MLVLLLPRHAGRLSIPDCCKRPDLEARVCRAHGVEITCKSCDAVSLSIACEDDPPGLVTS